MEFLGGYNVFSRKALKFNGDKYIGCIITDIGNKKHYIQSLGFYSRTIVFENCIFDTGDITDTTFNYIVFYKCTFRNIAFYQTTFHACKMSFCKFDNCSFFRSKFNFCVLTCCHIDFATGHQPLTIEKSDIMNVFLRKRQTPDGTSIVEMNNRESYTGGFTEDRRKFIDTAVDLMKDVSIAEYIA